MTSLVLIGVGSFVAIWTLISVAGAVPVRSLEAARLHEVSTDEGRRILARVYARTSVVDFDGLQYAGFAPLGVFQAFGLPGQPKIAAWERKGEATWLCGYVLADGQCQFDLVSLLSNSMLTTGTTKDGQLFPTRDGVFVQTFDIDTFSELLSHHDEGLQILHDFQGLRPDRHADFADSFETSMHEQGRFIRSRTLWFVRIPWWYFTRRGSRHNRSVKELFEHDISF